MNAARVMEIATRALIALGVFALLIGSVVWLMQRPRFDIRRIEIRSSAPDGQLQHVDRTAIRKAIEGRLRGNFFSLRLDEVCRAFETMPWIATASVRRVWPNQLVVTLTEHRALGVWDDGRLLSDTGVLFAADAAQAQSEKKLPRFGGSPQWAPEVRNRFFQFENALQPLSLAVMQLDVSERSSWHVKTTSGQDIELGREDQPGQIDARLAAIVANYPLIVARLGAQPVRIDARYSNGFAAAAKATKKS